MSPEHVQFSLKLIRVGMYVLISFAVLSLGAVESWAQAIVELGSAGLFLLWGILAIRRRRLEVHWNGLYLPLIGLWAVGAVQYTFRLTAYPHATKLELLRWGACILLFLLAVESFRTTDQIEELIWFLVVLGFFVSLFAIIQHFRFNGKLYWFLKLGPDAEPFGPFVNRDDFAGFVELTAPLGSALVLFQACRREKLPLLLLLSVLPIGALVLCASRGGISGFAFGLVLLLFFWFKRWVDRKQLLIAAALAVSAGSFVVWLGVREPIQRFGSLSTEEISRDRRVSMYRDTWQIFIRHPWIGTGLGTLVVVYPRYESYYDGAIVEHAHNDYLELLADTGLAGGFCGLAFVVLLFQKGLANLRSSDGRLRPAVYAGAMASCAGLLSHSFVDFNLHIPSNALILILLASVAATQSEPAVKTRLILQKEMPELVSRPNSSEKVPSMTTDSHGAITERTH
jgi:O-antigen ligase